MALIKERQPKSGLEMPEADEQAQEQYDRFVLAGLKAINAATEDLLAVVQQSEDPAEGLAQATVAVVGPLKEQAPDLPSDAFFQASIEIMKNIAQFGQDGGMFQADDALMNRAGQILMEQLMENYGTSEDYIALMDMMAQVPPEEAERIGAQQEAYASGTNQQ